MVPKQMRETLRPVLPRWTCSMAATFRKSLRFKIRTTDGQADRSPWPKLDHACPARKAGGAELVELSRFLLHCSLHETPPGTKPLHDVPGERGRAGSLVQAGPGRKAARGWRPMDHRGKRPAG